MKQYFKVLENGNVILSSTKTFKGGQIFCSEGGMMETVKAWEAHLDTEIKLIRVK